jgi:hypothetical protein
LRHIRKPTLDWGRSEILTINVAMQNFLPVA